MDTVVEEPKEESIDVTERSVLDTMIEEGLEQVQDTAPALYDRVMTTAGSKEQEEQNTLKDPTKVIVFHEPGSRQLIQTNLWCLVYHLPGDIFAGSPCKQNASPMPLAHTWAPEVPR